MGGSAYFLSCSKNQATLCQHKIQCSWWRVQMFIPSKGKYQKYNFLIGSVRYRLILQFDFTTFNMSKMIPPVILSDCPIISCAVYWTWNFLYPEALMGRPIKQGLIWFWAQMKLFLTSLVFFEPRLWKDMQQWGSDFMKLEEVDTAVFLSPKSWTHVEEQKCKTWQWMKSDGS